MQHVGRRRKMCTKLQLENLKLKVNQETQTYMTVKKERRRRKKINMVRSVKYIRLRTETSKIFSKQGTVCSGSKMRGISSPVNRLRFLNTLIHGVSYYYVVTAHRSLVLSSVCRQRQALEMAQSPTSEVKGSQLKPITNSHLDVRTKNAQSSISY